MKFTAPYKVGRTCGEKPCAYVVGTVDGDTSWIMCFATKLNDRPIGEQLRDMRRIAAALNRDEARKPTDYIVEIVPGTQYLAPWSGDPGRTYVRESAKRYPSMRSAQAALAQARRHRPLPMATITEAKRRPARKGTAR